MMTNTASQDKTVFGFWLYLMSDCLVFGALFATYAVLQSATFGGATGAELFSLSFVFIQTLILLTSSLSMGIALLAAHAGKKRLSLIVLGVTFLLGLLFLGMEVYEFSSLISEQNGPNQSAFLSSFFTLVGAHGLHVFAGLLWMLILMAHILITGLTTENMRRLTCLSLFWHFLDVIWIFIFTFVYLLGLLTS